MNSQQKDRKVCDKLDFHYLFFCYITFQSQCRAIQRQGVENVIMFKVVKFPAGGGRFCDFRHHGVPFHFIRDLVDGVGWMKSTFWIKTSH